MTGQAWLDDAEQSAWRHVAVIGGGVAGSAAAIRLRRHGIDVTLIEQARFPRNKVCGCCIGGAGLDVLSHLGCETQVRQAARPLTRWLGSIDGRTVDVSLTDNIAISRESLDCILIDEARRLGADVIQPAIGTIGDTTDRGIDVQVAPRNGTSYRDTFDGIVVATGLTSAKLGDALPWMKPPHGPFGVSFVIDDVIGFPDDAITMVCDHDGYVGIVLLEDGRLDVAAALRSGRKASQRGKPAERIAAILGRGDALTTRPWFDEQRFCSVTDVRTTPPLRRARIAGAGRILAIGDAAAYVEPFTGEGMTWGMAGGVGAADWIAGSRFPADRLADGWTGQLTQLLRRQRRECAFVSSTLKYSATRVLIGGLLSRFPALAKPVLSHLGRAVPFARVPSASGRETSS